ncbi:MAG TPA: glycerophosphodiester phosphodiesterase [Candidatus Rifleibacterium sp.]|nr:glycerophosphodiester phosphodiesterase [Candidatus Rifleibacterium sp.]HPT46997.1 glycerophosphodiester phosphodiesterase [Candidatus Rifleibacterium sp.]
MKKIAKALLILLIGGLTSVSAMDKTINIAHRGACAYLPEHTLQAKALAYNMDADYLEQDVVLTSDNVPIVIHDIHLDTVTDVATRFPERKRSDGRYYAIDFTFAEIKTLKVHERIDLATGRAVFSGRFPLGKSEFMLSSLGEEIEMIQGLNHSTGRNIGIYPEIKEPEWHRNEGRDITAIVLKTLADYGYSNSSDNIFLQCFDFAELKRIKNELKCELRLIQLIEEDCDIEAVAGYAYGIGPSISQIITGIDAKGQPIISDLVARAHQAGLKVHPYTFRADSLPASVSSEALLKVLFEKVGIDGIFSDFPDITGKYLRVFNLKKSRPTD